MSSIVWRQVDATEVVLEPGELKYRDDRPLSDIRVADNGAVCCARRVPRFAEVLAWPDGLTGAPVSWTGSPGLSLVRVFAFDSVFAYAFSDDQLLRIGPGTVETMHDASAPIRDARLSPDGRHIIWLEKTPKVRGYVAAVAAPLRPTRLQVKDYCHDVCWLTPNEILVLELHIKGDAETGQSLHVYDANGELLRTVLHMADYGLQFGPVLRNSRRVILFGHKVRGVSGHSGAQTGAWEFGVDDAVSRCLANASPAGGAAASLLDGCLFADARAQTAHSSRLVFASPHGCRMGVVREFLRDFALGLDGRTMLYRVLGDSFGIAELGLKSLAASDGAG
jgi:hypothetical protein